jgi:5-methylcytosine-specific restriction enzyme B
MARQISSWDISPILAAAERWISTCLIQDGSIFLPDSRWTPPLVDELYHAFVEHPDLGADDFITKLRNQMQGASPAAQQLVAEMLWALLLFPSNIKARTKRQQVRDIWALSGQQLAENHPDLSGDVLIGVGSGGPAFNTYRPNELTFLIVLVRDLKQRNESERRNILTDYDAFFDWINSVPQEGRISAISPHVEIFCLSGSRRENFIKQRAAKHS